MVKSPTAGRFLRDMPVNPHSDKEKKEVVEEEKEEEEEEAEEGDFLEPTLSTLSDNLSRPSVPLRTEGSVAKYYSPQTKPYTVFRSYTVFWPYTTSAKEPVYFGKSIEWGDGSLTALMRTKRKNLTSLPPI